MRVDVWWNSRHHLGPQSFDAVFDLFCSRGSFTAVDLRSSSGLFLSSATKAALDFAALQVSANVIKYELTQTIKIIQYTLEIFITFSNVLHRKNNFQHKWKRFWMVANPAILSCISVAQFLNFMNENSSWLFDQSACLQLRYFLLELYVNTRKNVWYS